MIQQAVESLSRAKTHLLRAATRPAAAPLRSVQHLKAAITCITASGSRGLEDRRYSLAARSQDFLRALIVG